MSAAEQFSLLLTLDQSVEYARQHIHPSTEPVLFLELEGAGLLPAFGAPEKRYLLGDIDALGPVLRALVRGEAAPYSEKLFPETLPAQVSIGKNTRLPLGNALAARDQLVLCPAIRHLVQAAEHKTSSGDNYFSTAQTLPWFGGTCVLTKEIGIAQAAETQVTRAALVAAVGAADFAGTAYYMGTKRDLTPFIVEALSGALPPDGIVLDLMCGSGAASGAFSRVWPTYASDAQLFCQHLAVVQGGGYSRIRVHATLPRILEVARSHEIELRSFLREPLRREAELCHSDITEILLKQFQSYVAEIPLFPEGGRTGVWDPCDEVAMRRLNPRRSPFCLFTAYFATIFFGLRQAVEIDSLRFAIEQLDDEEERCWALGALIVAVSVRATTYAAHFAQPTIRDLSTVSLRRLSKILEIWAGSIYHEFAVRFDRLAYQSESSKHAVTLLPGPWRVALDQFDCQTQGKTRAVYVDAPYTREEYSRYYHVLETLVRYNYPSATGHGKVPSKARQESFASEFFTRTQRNMEDHLVQVIRAVLGKGLICAWSYSNAGHANIPSVLEQIANDFPCRIESFAAPHRYISQRGRPPKDVLEYVVLFQPKW